MDIFLWFLSARIFRDGLHGPWNYEYFWTYAKSFPNILSVFFIRLVRILSPTSLFSVSGTKVAQNSTDLAPLCHFPAFTTLLSLCFGYTLWKITWFNILYMLCVRNSAYLAKFVVTLDKFVLNFKNWWKIPVFSWRNKNINLLQWTKQNCELLPPEWTPPSLINFSREFIPTPFISFWKKRLMTSVGY